MCVFSGMKILIISLPNSLQRREFQQAQMHKFKLSFEFLDATSVNDIDATIYQKHAKDWQRPLINSEIACYYSHKRAWQRVICDNQPMLILEDDALLSKCVPKLLADLANKTDIDLINLENVSRKKFVAKTYQNVACESKLLRLYLDRQGSGAYILFPQGAKKLLECEQNRGIAPADAHIKNCYGIKAYQIEPTPVIQLCMCSYYGIYNPVEKTSATQSIISVNRTKRQKGDLSFRIKRIHAQLMLGLYTLLIIVNSKRRYIAIRKQDF